MKFDQDQIEFAASCMARWKRICEDNGFQHCTSADIDHSALLRRLLSGDEPFDVPPPKAYAYPWYGFAEGKEQRLMEAPFISGTFGGTKEYNVVVAQSMTWKWVDKEAGILQHESGVRGKYWREERECKVFRDGTIITENAMCNLFQKVD